MKHIGEKFINAYGYEYEIIDYENTNRVTIEFKFNEISYRKVVSYSNAKKGKVASPYDKRQCGVGCLGLLSDGTVPCVSNNGQLTREYKIWCQMLNRVYNEKQLMKKPTYKVCSVGERWLVFANFLEDLPSVFNYEIWKNSSDYELDKDFLQKGKDFKVYSPETCIFISHTLNVYEAKTRPRNNKKEKIVPAKPRKVVRVSDPETGVYVEAQSQNEIAEMFKVSKSFISKVIKEKTLYLGFRIEVLYV